MNLEVHCTYTLPAERDLWAQAIAGADAAIEEAAAPHEHEWRIIEPGLRTLVFTVENFYEAFQLKEKIDCISLNGVTILAEIKS